MKFNPQINIKCPQGVYEPAEDSLLLIDIMNVRAGDRVLDVGTGTGIVALHCAATGARVTASDINAKAVACARRNAKRNSLGIRVVESDLFENLDGRFDIICFNPPYLPSYDDNADNIAWTGGRTGIELADKFLTEALLHLSTNGAIYMIVSSLSMQDKKFIRIRRHNYVCEVIARKSLFFEVLYGLRIVQQVNFMPKSKRYISR